MAGRKVTETSDYEIEYRSPIQPRTASRNSGAFRASGSFSPVPGSGGGGRVLKIVTEMGSSAMHAAPTALTKDAASSFVKATEKEKKDMQSLNDRLSNYINRVKNLEQKNRQLVAELMDLRGKWGKATREIKVEFAIQLANARKAMDGAGKEKGIIEVKIARLEEEIREMRDRFNDVAALRGFNRDRVDQYTAQLGDYQAEISMAHQRLKALDGEMRRYESDNGKLWDDLRKALTDLDQETINRIDFENQAQTLMEEIEFLRRVHDKELTELKGLLLKEPTDSKEFFKNELALAIRDIRGEYEYLTQVGKADMESWYKLKVAEVQGSTGRMGKEQNVVREEVARMRSSISDMRGKLGDLEAQNGLLEKQVRDLNYQLGEDGRQYEKAINDRDTTLWKMREDMEALVAEMQQLLDSKHVLDTEILIYRKILESEEHREERATAPVNAAEQASYTYTSSSAQLVSRARDH